MPAVAPRASIPVFFLLLVGCGHSEPTVDDGTPSGSSGPIGLGGSGKNGSTSGSGGASGAAGATSNEQFRSKTAACQAFEHEYNQLLPEAQACDPTAVPSPCVQRVNNEVACPCVTFAVGDLVLVEQLESIQNQWAASTCQGESDCSKVACPTAPADGTSGNCSNGRCVLP